MGQPAEVILLLRWCDLTLERLGGAREAIDALNVYPVPDRDTGTNLFLTFEAARQSMLDPPPTSFLEALTVFARGALLGARGNSGVILSQLMRAGADQLMRGDPTKPGQLLADTLTLAADAAYSAVARPVEGTILSVARAAERAAQEAVPRAPEEPIRQMGFVIKAAAEAAHRALDRTPEQLEVLALSGVVDAGGQGLCVILDAAVEAFTGRRPRQLTSVKTQPQPIGQLSDELAAAGPAYEVMYLLEAADVEAAALRDRLAELGDSVLVVGGDRLWNVHVHVDDVGAAIEAGIESGRPYRVRVTHFAQQTGRAAATQPQVEQGRGVVAFAAGTGLHRLFEDAGAVAVTSDPGLRWSTDQVLDVVRSTGWAEVIVLPNDKNTLAAAEVAAHAARAQGIRATVIPTRTQLQGLAAIAVHQPGRSFDDDVVSMTSAAGHIRHGAVTLAARDAMTTAGPARAGDSLGVVEGDFAVVSGDLAGAANNVIDRLLAGGGELLTLVRGEGCDDDLVASVTSRLAAERADVEICVFDGGQARYPLLIGVE